jgi:hypothetical protein
LKEIVNRQFRSIAGGHAENEGNSPHGGQRPAAGHHRLGVDEDEGDNAGFIAAIDPIVDRPALHNRVAGTQMHLASSRCMSISPEMTTA